MPNSPQKGGPYCESINPATFLSTIFASSLLVAQAYNCDAPSVEEVTLDKAHIRLVQNYSEAQEHFSEIYNDERRLKNRAYWSAKNRQFVFNKNNTQHILPQLFIKNLENHILQALDSTYTDFVYYGDMGHLHLLIPNQQAELSFQSSELLSLFHTGELYQFKENGRTFGPLKQDPHWQWLYWHRNFVGENIIEKPLIPFQAPPDALYNTVRAIEGYKEVGTVYFSANKNGCFELKNKSVDLRFDISVVL